MMRILLILITIFISVNLHADLHNYLKPSKEYKPKDFYGTWVIVKVKYFDCGTPNDGLEGLSRLVPNLGKRVIIQPNFFSDESDNSSLNITDFKYFVYTYDPRGSQDSKFDPNTYNVFIVDSPYKEKPNESFGSYGGFYIVNKNKIVSWRQVLIREEEAKKLDKYTVEVPYNYSYTCNRGSTEELTKKDEELDDYAKKLEEEGKYNVVRTYIGRSLLSSEELGIDFDKMRNESLDLYKLLYNKTKDQLTSEQQEEFNKKIQEAQDNINEITIKAKEKVKEISNDTTLSEYEKDYQIEKLTYAIKGKVSIISNTINNSDILKILWKIRSELGQQADEDFEEMRDISSDHDWLYYYTKDKLTKEQKLEFDNLLKETQKIIDETINKAKEEAKTIILTSGGGYLKVLGIINNTRDKVREISNDVNNSDIAQHMWRIVRTRQAECKKNNIPLSQCDLKL
ncbi:MAG: hypothetical protein LBQ34_04505 [Alphaproteobacteria bacterium]|jgi:hypothetical protein|nr:hypothetical protein [Alphaproteobacteria bacterium]